MAITRICHISSVHKLFDTRIFYKECSSLADAGYHVSLIIRHDNAEVINGINIIPLKASTGRFKRIFIRSFQASFKALKKSNKLCHFHDPELIPFVILWKFFGKKIIYDVHEDVPAVILDREWIPSPLRKTISVIAGFSEKMCYLISDALICATPTITAKFPGSKTYNINNFPIIKLIDSFPARKVEKSSYVFIYAGALTRIRGIPALVRAIGYLNGQAELWLVGEWENEEIKKESISTIGWEYCKYWGFLKLEETYGLMKAADVGLINFLPMKNHIHALPNKSFEYMACKLPMIISNFEYWRELFNDCALFAEAGNSVSISKQMEYAIKHQEEMRNMGQKGNQVVKKKYSWEAEAIKLTELYDKLLNTKQKN